VSQILANLYMLVRAVLLATALLFAGIALAAQGGRFSGRLDVLAHLTTIWLPLGLVAALIAALAARGAERPVALGAGLVVAISALILMAPTLMPAPKTPGPAAGPPLKIVQFNLWTENRDPKATLEWILAQDADIVTLEEADETSDPIMQGLRAAYPYREPCPGRGPCSTAVLSRIKPVSRHIMWSRERRYVAGGWVSFDDPQRGRYDIAVAHLSWPMRPVGLQRRQMTSLAQWMAPLDHGRLILAGDFNATPWSFSLQRFDRQLGLIRRTRGVASFPADRALLLGHRLPFPLLPIDQVYAGPGWRTLSVERGPMLGSDHYPVVIVLQPISPPSTASAPPPAAP
jgi:endonuclease/exonuclease/phosphatase (EEP) superfamily protein YafD